MYSSLSMQFYSWPRFITVEGYKAKSAKIRGRLFRQKWGERKDPEGGMSCRKDANVTGVQGPPRRKVSDRL